MEHNPFTFETTNQINIDKCCLPKQLNCICYRFFTKSYSSLDPMSQTLPSQASTRLCPAHLLGIDLRDESPWYAMRIQTVPWDILRSPREIYEDNHCTLIFHPLCLYLIIPNSSSIYIYIEYRFVIASP